MKTRLEVMNMRFGLSSTLTNSGVPFPNTDDEDNTIHNEFRVTVTRYLPGGLRIQRSFKWYGSQKDFDEGKVELTKIDLERAFRDFVDDAQLSTRSFKEFCSDLGYSNDSRRAERIYKESRKSLHNVLALGISEDRLTDILNGLSGQGVG